MAAAQPLTAQAGWFDGMNSLIDDNLIDPEDGMLDASDYLAGTTGFLPVPIIVTEPAVGAGGLGFRYRLARKMGMQVGADVARGPEDTAFYMTMGSAW